MLRCLVGRAGAGKTATCLREALAALATGPADGPPLILLAPEQATYQLERAVLDSLPDGGAIVRLQVLSFQRLARRVLERTAGPARPRLTESGRQMLAAAVLRAHRPALRVLAGSSERPGLAAALARQFAEFEAYAVSPEDLRAAAGACGGATDRLQDLALLWSAYRDRLGERAADPGSDLAAAAASLRAVTPPGTRVWVDGFAGFTPREEHILSGLVAAGAEVTVTLCLDGREPLGPAETDADHPFFPTRRTLRRLLALRPAARVERLDGPGRFAAGGDIALIEARLFADGAEAAGGAEGGGNADADRCATNVAQTASIASGSRVFFHVGEHARAEAEATAAEIDRLCREEGYRRREIAIIVRDMESYHDLVGPALAARGIPVFIDRKRPAGRHPVLATLSAALGVIVSGWRLDMVRRYLHCDLCGLRRDQADALENFALARGLSGARWRSPGPRLQARLIRPVLELEQALAGPVTGEAAAQALHRYLEAVRAPEAVSRWAEASGREEADWHRLCWQAAIGLLDQMALALAGTPVTVADVQAAIAAGVDELTVALVPPQLDQVLCGAVDRSRHPELRAAFVLGMADGAFPKAPSESAVLGDTDREALRAAGVELGPTAEERLLSERYLAYIALTRARERLYMSRPGGTAASDVWARVTELVPDGQALPPVPGPPRRQRSAVVPPPRIDPELARRLYPEVWTASRLEAVAACVFQHYARYGLRLQRREEAKVDPSHVGELLHEALARFVQGLLQDGRDVAALSPAEAARRAGDALSAAERHVLEHLPEGAARGPLLVRAAGRDLERAVRAMIAHAQAGEYRPAEAEWDFEYEGLRGRVDRVDAAVARDGTQHVRIIDYKTGASKFTLEGFYHSLDLAPALYLAAATAWSEVVPGGCFILPVRDQVAGVAGPDEAGPDVPRLQGLPPYEIPAAQLHERALDGAVTGVRRRKDGEPYQNAAVASAEDFETLRRALLRRAEGLRGRAFSGDLAPDPWARGTGRACGQCDFLDVCRFDPGAGDRPRTLAAVRRTDEAWALLRAEEDADG